MLKILNSYIALCAVLFFISACSKEEIPAENVSADFATPIATDGQDTVDDPAIYVHKTDASKSFVIATNKSKNKGGLYLYDLEGNELNFIQEGRMNNVDIRYDFPFDGRKIDLAVATHRTEKTLAIYEIDAENRNLINRGNSALKMDFEPYGGCLYHSPLTEKIYFFVTSKDGNLEQWELYDDGHKKISIKKVRALPIKSQAEGCVVDDKAKALFIAEEDKAIWKYDAEPDAQTQALEIDHVGAHLTDDIEGMALYHSDEERGYLIASSQGDNRYAIYERQLPHTYLGSFRISGSETMEGTEKTDGISVTHIPLNGHFPKGLFIAHDNRDSKGGGSNFKYVSWEKIEKALALNKN